MKTSAYFHRFLHGLVLAKCGRGAWVRQMAVSSGETTNAGLRNTRFSTSPKLHATMLHRRCHRLTTTLLVVLSLLFSQLALANYVCPGQAPSAAMAEMMAAGQPCEGMDDAQPLLCHQHAADAAQSFEPAKLPGSTASMLVLLLVLPLPMDACEAAVLLEAATVKAPPPRDPLFLSTLRLRV